MSAPRGLAELTSEQLDRIEERGCEWVSNQDLRALVDSHRRLLRAVCEYHDIGAKGSTSMCMHILDALAKDYCYGERGCVHERAQNKAEQERDQARAVLADHLREADVVPAQALRDLLTRLGDRLYAGGMREKLKGRMTLDLRALLPENRDPAKHADSAAAKLAALREGVEAILAGDYMDPKAHFQATGDYRCPHERIVGEDCECCMGDALRALLEANRDA